MLERLSSSSVALKPEQATCIQHVLEGKDFLWLPTGYGKSLCYEVLLFIFDYQLNRDNSAVLVVSPLLSLMMDHVDGVQAETAGFHYCLERCHAHTALLTDDVASNLTHKFNAFYFLLFSLVFCN